MPRTRPANLKILEGRGHGRDSGGRVVKTPPSYRRLPPEPPEILSGDALALWHQVVPELQRLQLTKPIDAQALAGYCLCWERFVEAQKIINEEGLLTTNSQGRVRHPAVVVLEAASKELRAWAVEFGLTPSAEMRLARQEANGDDQGSPFGQAGHTG